MNVNELPDDPAVLKKVILECSKQLNLLVEEIDFWKNKLYNRNSEKLTYEDETQGRLFNEADTYAAAPPEEAEESEATAETVSTAPAANAKTKKSGRKPLPASLPRKEFIHDIKEEEKICACGCQLTKIGEDVSEKLDVIPVKVIVEKHIRPKYACRNCEGVATEETSSTVKIAPVHEQLLPKTLLTPGLMAFLIVSKFCDALPFYRIEKIMKRMGCELSRQTMCTWSVRIAAVCGRLREILEEDMLTGNMLAADETSLQVLHELDRKPTQLSYMWVYRGGTADKPVLLFEYRDSHAGLFLKERLGDYKGYFQSDGFSAYNWLEELSNIILIACWAHARRKFFDAAAVSKNKNSSAHYALSQIQKLYAIERKAKDFSPDERKELREREARPILNKFKEWLDEKVSLVPPQGLLGRAIEYTLKLWPKLNNYLLDGNIPIDNNAVENAIRPFVIGKKNWLFSDTPAGAHASALYYTLIENAKANGLEPYWYLRYLFENILSAKTKEDFRNLLPQHVDKEKVRALRFQVSGVN